MVGLELRDHLSSLDGERDNHTGDIQARFWKMNTSSTCLYMLEKEQTEERLKKITSGRRQVCDV
jgi:hypothetical protein